MCKGLVPTGAGVAALLIVRNVPSPANCGLSESTTAMMEDGSKDFRHKILQPHILQQLTSSCSDTIGWCQLFLLDQGDT